MSWTLTQVRELANSRGWTVDVTPDWDRGFAAAVGGTGRIAVTMECGYKIEVSSQNGILNGCLPILAGIFDELGLTPF